MAMVMHMTRASLLSLAGILALAYGLLAAGIQNAAADSITFKAMVIEVKDGDTLVVLRNKTRLTVKLPGIDAPELDQPFGPEAKRFAAKLVQGKVVTVEMFQPGNPIYGTVRLSKNRILAHEMVKAGMAWAMTSDKSSVFSEAQQAAKSARLGLWVNSEEEEPIPPWEWRAQKRFGK
jgi:endonuclease YncB( thermonuclease family)